MKLQLNESPVDRVLRIVLGLALAVASIAGAIATPLLYLVRAACGDRATRSLVGRAGCPPDQ